MTEPEPSLYGDVVELAGLVFDGRIHDSAKWGADQIEGWDESPEETYVAPRFPNRDGVAWAEDGTFYLAKSLVLHGYLAADNRVDFLRNLQTLKSAVVTKGALTLVRHEPGIAKQMDVRLAGQITYPSRSDTACNFQIPLLAPNPFKSSLDAPEIVVGTKAPATWTRRYPRRYPLHYTATAFLLPQVVDTNWVLDPSFEAITTQWTKTSSGGTAAPAIFATEARRNLIPNSAPGSVTGYVVEPGSGGAAALSYLASGGPGGAGAIRATWTTAPTSSTTPAGVMGSAANLAYAAPVTPGTTYTASIYYKTSYGGIVTAAITWLTSAGAVISRSQVLSGGDTNTLTSEGFLRNAITDVAPAGAAYAVIGGGFPARQNSVWVPPAGGTIDFARFMLEAASTYGTYFDGTTAADAGGYYSWVGTANQSASIYSKYATMDRSKSMVMGWSAINTPTTIQSVQFPLNGAIGNHYVQLSFMARSGTAVGTLTATVTFFNPSNVPLGTLTIPATATTAVMQRLSANGLIPVGATSAQITISVSSATVASGNVQIDAVMLNGQPTSVTTRTNLLLNPNGTLPSMWGNTVDAAQSLLVGLPYPTPPSTTAVRAEFGVPAGGAGTGVFCGVSASDQYGNNGVPNVPCVAGTAYSGALWVRPSQYQQMTARFQFYDASHTLISSVNGPVTPCSGNAWTQVIAVNVTAPANAAFMTIGVFSTDADTTFGSGASIDATAAQIEVGASLGPYFDGGSPNTGAVVNQWTGTVNASTSTQVSGGYFDGATGGAQWSGVPELSVSQRIVLLPVDQSVSDNSFTNRGDQVEWPISTVTGPLPLGWMLQNLTTGKNLGFMYALRDGQTMTIDHLNQTASVNNGDSAEVFYFGDWWPLVEGINNLRLYSPQYSTARWTLSPRSRWA